MPGPLANVKSSDDVDFRLSNIARMSIDSPLSIGI